MVKLSHTVFALPFAFSGAVLAAGRSGIDRWQLLWIAVAMFSARNAAMAFNRLADRDLDARNPRTSGRELPRGVIGPRAVGLAVLALSALFVLAAFQLSTLCGALSPVALLVILGYSYAKRVTWASHLVLGLGLALAPVGAWLAVAGELTAAAWLLGAAVLAWVAGFDILYALQDREFDLGAGLHSIPARFGVRGALLAARALHALALILLAAVGPAARLHPVYWAGWLAVAAILILEHRLVRPGDLSRLDVAFFNMNGVISVVYLATTLAAVLWPRLAAR